MTATLTTIRGTRTGCFKVQVHADGVLIGQAVDADLAMAEKRARKAASRWAADRGWREFSIRKPAREIK
jgi:hypothetical protein